MSKYPFHKFYGKNRSLKLNREYWIIWYNNKSLPRRVRFVKSTKKGYNFFDEKLNKMCFKRHLYVRAKYSTEADLVFYTYAYLKITPVCR